MRINRVLTAAAVTAIAYAPMAVAHANPADEACSAQASAILHGGGTPQQAQQALMACESGGGSPNNGQPYVPGKAGAGPQQPPPRNCAGSAFRGATPGHVKLVGCGPGDLNNQLIPGDSSGPPPQNPPIQPVIPQPQPGQQQCGVTLCPIVGPGWR
jgi:hypothetical protein